MLSCLSDAQREAVTWDAAHPLQILAGPGSGKTRVLTTRVAWLVQGGDDRAALSPGRCVVVTFTNKAATEMRTRLNKLIGEEKTRALILGTFHATCVKFLRRWGHHIGLASNFTIADVDDTKRIVKDVHTDFEADLAAEGMKIKPEGVLNAISRSKSRCMTPEQFRTATKYQLGTPMHREHIMICNMYAAYQNRLEAANALDFDDLLMRGVQLFREHPQLARRIEHVLVDEFQDTNAVQYELMCRMAASSRHVSIVGDPDQSIYSWRHADMSNLERMHTDFPGVHRVFLEQSFRSTPAILEAALAVMKQDPLRIQKGLYTTHAHGAPVMLRSFADADEEARYVALEIQRHVQCTNGLLDYNDMSILLRFNAQSRPFEAALQRHGIPYRILGGLRFFDRAEIKDILAYLLITENPMYTPGVMRIINTPKRGLGPKTVQSLEAAAQHAHVPLMRYLENISPANPCGMRPAHINAIQSFVNTIHELGVASKSASVSDLIQRVLQLTRYEDHLRHNEDFESRWENVQELINFASSLDNDEERPAKRVKTGNEAEDEEGTPLATFLESSALTSDLGMQDTGARAVTICTCHAAKGLEWPVVFLPASEDGIFPFYRSTTPDEQREERRLYYVAMTRAQTQLCLTWAHRRLVMSEWCDRSLTPFLKPLVSRAQGGSGVTAAVPWSMTSPPLDEKGLATTAIILSRPPVPQDQLNKLMNALYVPLLTQRRITNWSATQAYVSKQLKHGYCVGFCCFCRSCCFCNSRVYFLKTHAGEQCAALAVAWQQPQQQ